MNISVMEYDESKEKIWDLFISEKSINGTFLQERRFLNYHPKGRFQDNSLMIYDGNELIALLPGCEVSIDEKRVFFSHQGSSYGDVIISSKELRLARANALIDAIESYLNEKGFERIIIKATPQLLCTENMSAWEYIYYLRGYADYKEPNVFIDYSKYGEDIASNLSSMKRRNIKKAISYGIELKKLDLKEEIIEFHNVLTINLKKFNREPIHTPEELWDLYHRLGKDIEFYGAFYEDKIIAGTMIFIFDKTKCALTQYLASNPEYQAINAMAYVYYKMIEMFMQRRFSKLSWGIVSEHLGHELNWGLANNKEEFGGSHSINHIYEKDLK